MSDLERTGAMCSLLKIKLCPACKSGSDQLVSATMAGSGSRHWPTMRTRVPSVQESSCPANPAIIFRSINESGSAAAQFCRIQSLSFRLMRTRLLNTKGKGQIVNKDYVLGSVPN
uniref:Uncharacterized protein n=1 Tax=Cacopsylla melanoneura TaxID=428564 RepID=A0A8D8ZA83_9HEMI